MSGIVTIDFDFTNKKRGLLNQLSTAQKLLHNLKPCYARVSSSKRGFHILKFYAEEKLCEKLYNYKKFCKPLEWAEEIYDDPKRKMVGEIRAKHGLTSKILFDVKAFRKVTRIAGEWQEIQDAWDVELFLDYFFDFWRL